MEKLQRSKGLDVTLSLIKMNCVYKKKKEEDMHYVYSSAETQCYEK